MLPLQNPEVWKSVRYRFVDAQNATGVAKKDDEREDNIGLIDTRAPRYRPFGAHIIDEQKQGDTGGESRCEPDHERDPDIDLCDDNERAESRTPRENDRTEQTLIPGVTVLEGEFEETSEFIRTRVAVIAKDETDSHIHAGENEQPLSFSYRLFVHGFSGDLIFETTRRSSPIIHWGFGFNSQSTLMIFQSPLNFVTWR